MLPIWNKERGLIVDLYRCLQICQGKDARIAELEIEKKDLAEQKRANDSNNLELAKKYEGLHNQVHSFANFVKSSVMNKATSILFM